MGVFKNSTRPKISRFHGKHWYRYSVEWNLSKIALVRGHHIYHYADRSIETNGATLIFFNPKVPYTFEQIGNLSGYFCIFKEAFFSKYIRGGIKNLPMFLLGNEPSYSLNEAQDTHVSDIFKKMINEMNGDYRFKFDLLRSFILEIVHYALKIQPSETLVENVDANGRLARIFNELLERQFPIESTSQRFTMRSAKAFAEQLSVHVNHLNRALRKSTGKTTSSLIYERVTNEAKMLLKHTDWDVSQIGYTLGFDEPAHFNTFFKKQTSITPSRFRG